jgi:hypothetical protein
MKLFTLSFISAIYLSLAGGITLQSVFDAAGPGNIYDKYVVLEQNMIYTGEVGVYEGSVFIEGNGAIVDLQEGSGIWVYADATYPASLDIQYTTIINGAYHGLSYGGVSTGSVSNCNFVHNDIGIKMFDESNVYITNCNFIENTTYGLGIYNSTPSCNINYCNAWNNGEAAWMENCLG